jgi:hypothetical protein
MPVKPDPDLSAEVARLKAELAAAKAATGGLLPLVLHVGGAAHRGTARLVVRCEPAGAYAERWMARVGEQLIGQDGSRLAARPFAQIRPALQERVAWPDLASAIQAAQTATLEG